MPTTISIAQSLPPMSMDPSLLASKQVAMPSFLASPSTNSIQLQLEEVQTVYQLDCFEVAMVEVAILEVLGEE